MLSVSLTSLGSVLSEFSQILSEGMHFEALYFHYAPINCCKRVNVNCKHRIFIFAECLSPLLPPSPPPPPHLCGHTPGHLNFSVFGAVKFPSPEFLQPIVGQPFGHKCNIFSKITLHFHVTLFGSLMTMCMIGLILTFHSLVPNSPPLLLGEGRVSNACGMLRGWMLSIKILVWQLNEISHTSFL